MRSVARRLKDWDHPLLITGPLIHLRGSAGGSAVKNLPGNAGDMGSIPGREDPLKEEMTAHSSTLTWEIPCTEGPVRGTVHVVAKESET